MRRVPIISTPFVKTVILAQKSDTSYPMILFNSILHLKPFGYLKNDFATAGKSFSYGKGSFPFHGNLAIISKNMVYFKDEK